MKTIRMKWSEGLLARVDRAARKLGTNRSAFTRDALEAALARLPEHDLEQQQRAGYERHPVGAGEFQARLDEQSWPD